MVIMGATKPCPLGFQCATGDWRFLALLESKYEGRHRDRQGVDEGPAGFGEGRGMERFRVLPAPRKTVAQYIWEKH